MNTTTNNNADIDVMVVDYVRRLYQVGSVNIDKDVINYWYSTRATTEMCEAVRESGVRAAGAMTIDQLRLFLLTSAV